MGPSLVLLNLFQHPRHELHRNNAARRPRRLCAQNLGQSLIPAQRFPRIAKGAFGIIINWFVRIGIVIDPPRADHFFHPVDHIRHIVRNDIRRVVLAAMDGRAHGHGFARAEHICGVAHLSLILLRAINSLGCFVALRGRAICHYCLHKSVNGQPMKGTAGSK